MEVRTIFGPPGTGKTRTLVDYAEREGQGIYLSYTRAAATEALSRVRSKAIRPMTLHSLAFNSLGMNRSAVVDKAKLRDFAKATGIPFKGTEDGVDEEQEGDQYAETYSYSRNAMVSQMEAYERFGCPGTLTRYEGFAQQYESWKETYGYMDFDDMLTLYSRNGKCDASTVFLDEAQDLTPLQWRAFDRATERARRVYLGGDDDQAIYEWNGADPHGMIKFTDDHGGKVRVLEQSYRLPRIVFLMADTLIRDVKNRQEKKFRPTDREGDFKRYRDLEFIIDKLGTVAPDGALILMRDRFKVEEMKRALNRELVPYDVYGGFSPWTGKLARAIRAGERPEVPLMWRDFYRQADLTQPIKYALSTVHSAKGREHETVIMDLDMPTRVLAGVSKDRDAEVRVQYVGLTRTKSNLILCGNNPLI